MSIGKILKLTAVSVVMAAFSLSQFSFSGEMPKASKRANVEYFEILYIKYKVGKAEDADGLIKKYFIPASEAAGTPQPYVIDFQTGPWDRALFWAQKNGMADFDWSTSPNDEKWYGAFVKLTGSMEKAEEVLDKYYGMIAQTRRDIGHHQMEPQKTASK